MEFIAESVTTFYDKEQDRLSLIFCNKDKKQLLGFMTRQFLINLLKPLPHWLSQQYPNSGPRTTEQQWEINCLEHQFSQQKITVRYGKIHSSNHIESFLISTVNLSKRHTTHDNPNIKLEFYDAGKAKRIFLMLNPAQLHKLIGEILKQVKSWDIDNPWQNSNAVSFLSNSNGGIVH
ncbi:MAG: hypothetical protein E6Q62_06990 [Nitrosomonas sp.]|nr:MAG: hypothetical protein E6Q62_06990 [Nitrosomonas sp.]